MHCPIPPKYTIQNINVHIFALNGVLWDMGQMHFGICEIGLLVSPIIFWIQRNVEYAQVESCLEQMQYNGIEGVIWLLILGKGALKN